MTKKRRLLSVSTDGARPKLSLTSDLFGFRSAIEQVMEDDREMQSAVSGRQVKAARALLGWSQRELVSASKVSMPTIRRIEALGGELRAKPQTIRKIVEALERAGIRFIFDGGSGVKLNSK